MDEDTKKKNTMSKTPGKQLISDAVIVAGLTAVAYLTACAYQFAFISSFKIPVLFLSVDSNLVLMTALALLVWMSSIVILFSLLLHWKIVGWVKATLMIIVVLIFVGLPILLLILDPKHPWVTLVGIILAVVVTSTEIRAMNRHKNAGTEPTDGFTQLLNLMEKFFGVSRTLIIVVSFIFLLCGFGFGSVVAKYQSNFLVPTNNPGVAIITTYKDQFVGLVFDVDTRKLSEQVVLINQSGLDTSTVFENLSLLK